VYGWGARAARIESVTKCARPAPDKAAMALWRAR
jgi:hypothetical protein